MEFNSESFIFGGHNMDLYGIYRDLQFNWIINRSLYFLDHWIISSGSGKV